MNFANSVWESFDHYAHKREIIRIAAEKVHLSAGLVFIGLLTIIFFLLFKGIGSQVISLFLLFVYPSYMTFKALHGGKPELTLRFAKYWIVLGFGTCFFTIFPWLLSAIPLLGFVKCLFAYILVRSSATGAVHIYDGIVMPVLRKYESYIDEKLAELQGEVERSKKDLTEAKEQVSASLSKEKAH